MSFPRGLSSSLLLALAGLTASGCGGNDALPDPTTVRAGEQVFTGIGCATCHTLAAAGARGTIGPSLDQRLPSRDEVARRVRAGGSGMPSFSDRLDDADVDAVAAYVAAVAGQEPGGR